MEIEKYMHRCLQLAKNGLGHVAPNPLVGAVIVSENRIIGEGYHRKYGGPHAEVNALASVKKKELLSDSTLFVNLEPCSHFGKTPPCVDSIISARIPRVVVAMRDPNPKVAGRGIERLRNAGIEVEEGILNADARFLNRRFICFHTQKRPYILLKWAESADGFMDRKRDRSTGVGVNWISHPETKKLVHLWRSQEQVILVGRKTIENDNPSLTTRLVDGPSPLRAVLATSGAFNPNAHIFTDGNPTLIFNANISKKEGGTEWIKTQGDPIHFLIQNLYEQNISSIMVEGGARLNHSFLSQNLWDEVVIIQSDISLGAGLPAPKMGRTPDRSFHFGKDRISRFYNV